MGLLASGIGALVAASAATSFTVRVEEPTGLYRRVDEVAAVPLAKVGGHTSGYVVVDAAGRELPWQVGSGELLFPVSVVPGELPEYTVACCAGEAAPRFRSAVVARRVGLQRLELGNARFRAIVDLGVPAVVEAYALSAGPQRVLNLVETTPETPAGLAGDIHEDSPEALAALPPHVPGVEGENVGWTSAGGTGAMTGVELVETGPLRARVRLTRAGETWELTWTSTGAWLRWKASRGFRFRSLSAAPYLPFDRCVGGSELAWPTGPGEGEPPDRQVAPRPWTKLPGGHVVYYQRAENYGALGIVALDPDLSWTGVGSRRFVADKPDGETEIALTFPHWRENETALEARKENRLLRHPVLVQVIGPAATLTPAITRPAPREPAVDLRSGDLRPTAFAAQELSLDGEWELAWCEKGEGPPEAGWRTVRVPGSAHVQWLGPERAMTREGEWISTKEWWYRRSFRLPKPMQGHRLRLQLDATDYYADTYLNGAWLGRHEGYIDPYELDASAHVQPAGENRLLVRVWTPVHYYWKHRPYTVKGAYGAVDQKPDDITPLGITRSARLVGSRGPTIRDVAVGTRLAGSGSDAEVEVQLEANGHLDGHAWELTLSPRTFGSGERIQARVGADEGTTRVVLPVKQPRLWWTWDHGRPDLYTLDVRLVDAEGGATDGRSLAVGIREIEKIGWDFYLNRKKMFVRGTNLYYHLFLSEMGRVEYERDLALLLRMNVNMVRLHCHFSNPEVYDLADERGLLIWQDFLEAWYPHDRAFSLRAAALYDNHLRYVRNHPSIALWATSDEEDFENYRDLTKHLAPRAALLDPQLRPVVRSTGRFGDSHVYHGWYGGSIWEYAKMDARFVSELGATSLPNYETLAKFMGGKWPIRDHADEWTWRRLQISEAMRAWGEPGSMGLREYIPRTQAYVARLFQLALERMRRRKPAGAGGILHFHAIDIWPSVTMAAIDFERRPTKVFDTVRRSFEPVAALFEYDRARWAPGDTVSCGLWAVNDRWEALGGASVHWRIVDAKGADRDSGSWKAPLAADSAVKLGDVRWTAAGTGSYELRAEVRDARGRAISENVFEFEVAAGPER